MFYFIVFTLWTNVFLSRNLLPPFTPQTISFNRVFKCNFCAILYYESFFSFHIYIKTCMSMYEFIYKDMCRFLCLFLLFSCFICPKTFPFIFIYFICIFPCIFYIKIKKNKIYIKYKQLLQKYLKKIYKIFIYNECYCKFNALYVFWRIK